MTLNLRYAARSDVGLRREGNEDSLYAGPRLLVVADGVGGQAAGEVASAVAIAALAPLDEDAPGADLLDALRSAVANANVHLRDMMAGDSALVGMGTTLTALLWGGARLGLAHVGDSRAYLLRDGELTQITHDHTLVQALVDEGRITSEQAGYHPQRSVVLRALDGRGEVDLDLSVREARDGDRYLLCTDGLTGVVSEATVRDSLLLAYPQEAVDRLVELALRGGGPDNITCIVADVVDSSSPGNEPVLVAGAAAGDNGGVPSPATSAGRAALATGRGARRRPPRRPRATGTPVPLPPPRRSRQIVLPLLLALLLAALAGAGVLYVRSQFYVGAAGGEAAIYQGLTGSVAGIDLSGVHERLGVRVADLPSTTQQRVRQGISASSLADARRIGGRLRAQSTPDCIPPIVLPPTASASPSDGAGPAPTSSPATGDAAPTPTPSTCPPESQ